MAKAPCAPSPALAAAHQGVESSEAIRRAPSAKGQAPKAADLHLTRRVDEAFGPASCHVR